MKFYFYLALANVTICLFSCSPVLYTTVGQNVPLFRQKGEVAMSGGSAETYDAKGFSLQCAVAVDSSWAIISSLYSLKSNEDIDWSGKGSYFEIGAGKFKHSNASKLTGEIFVGSGFGTLKNFSSYGDIEQHYIKPFIQPSGGFSSQVIDLAFTARLGMVFFNEPVQTLTDNEYKTGLSDFYDEMKSTFVFEPGITARIGFKNMKLQFQYNYTTFQYKKDNFNPVNEEFLSFGFFILFSNRWLKNNSK